MKSSHSITQSCIIKIATLGGIHVHAQSAVGVNMYIIDSLSSVEESN